MPISPSRSAWLCASVSACFAAAACDSPPSPTRAQTAPPVAVAARPELVPAPADLTDVQAYVAQELTRAQREQRPLLVYVGAAWCEPCRRFHEAVESGALGGKLPAIRFLEFDYDQQRAALSGAGYTSRLLPLFSVPNADGSASSRQIEGSIKGETAVQANLVPRLQALLERPPAP